MDSRLEVGKLYLLDMGLLAKITRLNSEGFDFWVINGGWDGHFAFEGGVLTIKYTKEKRPGCKITCFDQPPSGIERQGYNSIIAWMCARAGEAA